MNNNEWWHDVKGIPKSEKICVKFYNNESKILTYIITVDFYQSYKLYKYDIEKAQAVYTKHKADNPLKLEKYV